MRPYGAFGRRRRLLVERFFQFALLGLVASGFLAVAGSGYLDLPTIALTAAGLALRGLTIAGFYASGILRARCHRFTAIYAAFFCWIASCFRGSCSPRPYTWHSSWSSSRCFSEAGRDYLYLAAIAVIELLAAALLSIDLKFFLALALCAFAIAALTSAGIRRSVERAAATTARDGLRRFHLRLAVLVGFITLGILALLTAAMFFVLPRTADAALSRFARHALFPGFTDQVNLGATGDIGNSSRPVVVAHLRQCATRRPAVARSGAGRFRRPALVQSGRPEDASPVENGQADLGRERLRTRTPFGISRGFRRGKSAPRSFSPASRRRSMCVPLSWSARKGSRLVSIPPSPGFHYDACRPAGNPPRVFRRRATLLRSSAWWIANGTSNCPRVWTRKFPRWRVPWRGWRGNRIGQARAIEARLRRDYGYTLRLPSRESADPLADFLFQAQGGHCEYFASAMTVLLLRTAGIPARIITAF